MNTNSRLIPVRGRRCVGALRPRSDGFALIEVMVAVLLFAIGILGLVGLQASMMQAQTSSKVRADAANLADELTAIIWSDMTNIAAYTTGGCAGNARCNGWLTKLPQVLPGGTLQTLTIDLSGTSITNQDYGLITVTLNWSLPNGGTHTYTSISNVVPAAEVL
jgi:type IV pilus assembly protein PilV